MPVFPSKLQGRLSERVTVAEILRQQIRDGRYKAGERLPTFAQLQVELGAATNTVDRAFTTLEKEGLVVRRRGSGVYVAEPRRRSTGNVGILGFQFADTHQHPYFLHLIRGLQEAAQAASQEILFLNPDVEAVRWEKVDGVVINGALRQLHQILPPHMPCVALLRRMEDTISIVAEEYQGVYDATRHLLDLGHTRIAMLSESELRLAGYRTALQDAGVVPRSTWTHPVYIPAPGRSGYREAGHASINCWLKEADSPWSSGISSCTALLAHNDDVAIGAIEALRETGRRVPDDISVVGFDGTEIIKYFSPRLSTVRMPLEDMGRIAVETLCNWIDGEAPSPQTIALPTMFESGESSAPVAASAIPKTARKQVLKMKIR